jgi:probable HAF family extracellular repeat protein
MKPQESVTMRRTAALTALVLLTAGSAPFSQGLAPPRPIETIDVAAGRAVGLNWNHDVVYVQRQPGAVRSFVWREGTGARDLGGLDPEVVQTWAAAISDAGHIVGTSLTAQGFYHPFIWHGTGLIDVEPDPTAESAAWAVNSGGELVGGFLGDPGPTGSALRWTPASCHPEPPGGCLSEGTLTYLNPLGGTCGSGAYDINMFGNAVGESSIPGGCDEPYVYRPFVWTRSSVRDLGTLGGLQGRALRINSLNQVIGDSTTAAGHWHAFLWSERTGMRDLGTLGGTWSLARAISEMGHVVGTTANARGEQRAFLWTPFGGMRDLGPGEALAVNSFDHVVGSWTDAGVVRAFLWTPSEGRITLDENARAIAITNRGYVLGETRLEWTSPGVIGDAHVVIWRFATTDADWLSYRRGLVDAHLAYGHLNKGQAQALHAQLTNVERALAAGDAARANRALWQFARHLHQWAPDELPWY